MLGKKPTGNGETRAPSTPQHNTVETLIGDKTTFTGDIEFKGGLLRIEGVVKGSITASDETDGVLVLAESGRIEGNVHVPNVVVNGTVTGNIFSGKRIELEGKARVVGDIKYNNIEMGLGAVVNGSLVREAAPAPAAAPRPAAAPASAAAPTAAADKKG